MIYTNFKNLHFLNNWFAGDLQLAPRKRALLHRLLQKPMQQRTFVGAKVKFFVYIVKMLYLCTQKLLRK